MIPTTLNIQRSQIERHFLTHSQKLVSELLVHFPIPVALRISVHQTSHNRIYPSFIMQPIGSEKCLVQLQVALINLLILLIEPVNNFVDQRVSKSKCSSGEHVRYAWHSFGIVAAIFFERFLRSENSEPMVLTVK